MFVFLFSELTFGNLPEVTPGCEKVPFPSLRLNFQVVGAARRLLFQLLPYASLRPGFGFQSPAAHFPVAAGTEACPPALPTSACRSQLPLPTLCPLSGVSSDLPNGALPSISFSAEMLFAVCVDDGGVETVSQHIAHVGLKPSMK